MVDIDLRVSSHLKEELTWAIDKRLQVISNYRTHTKFRGINFCALAGSEFRGSIFSCGVIFVDTRCLRSEINFQLCSYIQEM